MISMMMFVFALFIGKQGQERPIDYVHHDTYSVAALADGMSYYQTQAIEKCWQNGASTCAAGPINLTDRAGSQVASGYRAGYETITDGVNYIATTLAAKGLIAGRTHQESNVNSGIFAALKGMTSGSSTVGYYDQTAGGVVLPDKDNAVVSVTFASAPVQGQPVLYSSIATASPPAQLASIDGGGYSPVVPISAPITPTASPTPEAIVSPPAAVSPPEAVSPTYAPPATVVINPISPWAPSPVPPPPPPPVPPPPPPPPPVPPSPPAVSPAQVAIAQAAKDVSYLGWGPIEVISGGGRKSPSKKTYSTAIEIWLTNSSGGIIYSFFCLPGTSTATPLVSDPVTANLNGKQVTSVGGIIATNLSSDTKCKMASNLIELFIATGNAFYNNMPAWIAKQEGVDPDYGAIIGTTIYSYGITTMGSFGKSDVAFSGTGSGISYFSTQNLYGGIVPEPTASDVGQGMTYEQSAQVDEWVSEMTDGEY